MARSRIIPNLSAASRRSIFQSLPARSPFSLPSSATSPRPTIRFHLQSRNKHTIPRPLAPGAVPIGKVSEQPDAPAFEQPKPSYQLTFTCVPCNTRSQHTISKQGYHHGSVLIACPSCKNRHIISDNLKIFGDKAVNVEDLLRERGELVKRGTLGEDGDLEFWDDGSETSRAQRTEGEGVKSFESSENQEQRDAPAGETFSRTAGR